MTKTLFSAAALLATMTLTACGNGQSERMYLTEPRQASADLYANETPELRQLIRKYAVTYDVPEPMIHRIIKRESNYRPGARNGPYYGLMQILPQTARGMGYQGSPTGLLDAETNLKYGVKYLRGAYMVADGNPDATVKWYSRGYYYEAKRKGLLQATGLR